jgi:hypothetical protein
MTEKETVIDDLAREISALQSLLNRVYESLPLNDDTRSAILTIEAYKGEL